MIIQYHYLHSADVLWHGFGTMGSVLVRFHLTSDSSCYHLTLAIATVFLNFLQQSSYFCLTECEAVPEDEIEAFVNVSSSSDSNVVIFSVPTF